MASSKQQQLSVLSISTLAFTVCFAVWVMFSIIGIPIKTLLKLNETEFGLLAATPILSGSLIRLPLGMWTDRYGGRVVFLILMLCTILPIYMIGDATSYWQFLALGFCVGIAGGSFSVGISYVARWFTKPRQGFAMGIFGAGNAGAAVTKFVAPSIVASYGWRMVPKVYAVAMLVTACLFWAFSHSDPKHRVSSSVTVREQLRALKDITVWRYSQYYAIVFGGYVGLSLWMTKYYINEFGLSLKTAALVASIFVLPSGVIRALGGWISDKVGAHTVTCWILWISWGCLFVLSYPQADLAVKTVTGEARIHLGLNIYLFTALLFVVGLAWGFGKASVFKHIADDYPHQIGVISGIVGLMGGLGGFVLPIVFGALVDLTGVRSSAFMFLFAMTSFSLVLMLASSHRHKKRHKAQVAGAMA
jgi:MFS transporter, NNP family, nitrate/nitrite transporter